MDASFQRYLLAKVSVDDRALNAGVWDRLRQETGGHAGVLRVLEIGGGIGTMAARLLGAGIFDQVQYTLIDSRPDNIDFGFRYLSEQLPGAGFKLEPAAGSLEIRAGKGPRHAEIQLEAIDVFDFIQRESGLRQWDLIIAHAFLDLMPLPGFLRQIAALGKPGSLHYYSVNFDGATIFEPVAEPAIEDRILQLYHRSMDDRLTDGVPSGDSRSGRHLFSHLRQLGFTILAAGSSDWLVFAQNGRYPADEQWFLEFFLGFFASSLTGHPELAPAELGNWLAQKQRQVASGELALIVHQLDFLARQSG